MDGGERMKEERQVRVKVKKTKRADLRISLKLEM